MKVYLLLLIIIVEGISAGIKTRPLNSDGADIDIDASIQYQSITGWEATAQAGQLECEGFEFYKDTLYDSTAGDLGINRLRLQVKSGSENRRDFWSDYRDGKIDRSLWRGLRYSTVNDNDDPLELNWEGFHFSELDHTVENVVLPMRRRVEVKGERLFVNLIYIAFTKQNMPGAAYHHQDPQEYAEFLLAASLHLREKYGLVPDTWEVILEPDNVPEWDGELIGNAITAAAGRLEENGFDPKFVAPSNANMGSAVKYFDEMIAVPGVEDYLKEFSYHRYGGVSPGNLMDIGERASLHQVDTAMLEHIGGDYQELHQDLKVGLNSTWHQFTLGFCGEKDDGGAYYIVDGSDPENPGIQIGERTKFLRQYFKYIRNNARRIEAFSSHKTIDPLAFINPDGGYVIVVKADSEAEFEVRGLPGGEFGIKYTTFSEYDIDHADVILESGQNLITSIPGKGVLTIYMKQEVNDESPSDTPITAAAADAAVENRTTPVLRAAPGTAVPSPQTVNSAAEREDPSHATEIQPASRQTAEFWGALGAALTALAIGAGLVVAYVVRRR